MARLTTGMSRRSPDRDPGLGHQLLHPPEQILRLAREGHRQERTGATRTIVVATVRRSAVTA
jgi:hypothetical protein